MPPDLSTGRTAEHRPPRGMQIDAGGIGGRAATREFDIHGGDESQGTLGILRIAGDDVG
jgi:hypothetical protein